MREFESGSVGQGATTRCKMTFSGYEQAVLAALVPAMIFASWNDYRRHRVPNWLNASILVLGIGVNSYLGSWNGLSASLLGAGVGFGCLFVFWAMRAMGAGDVKFMAAVGAWMGPSLTFQAVLAGGLIGGAMAVGMIAYQRRWMQTYLNLGVVMKKVGSAETAFGDFGSARELNRGASVMPYAIPLTLGSLCVLFSNFFGWGGLL
ncbi:MAG: prepilin peptidase [Planctomycetes bacterium]|nr:prepilin peptidase [Planctomycetota bacterium]